MRVPIAVWAVQKVSFGRIEIGSPDRRPFRAAVSRFASSKRRVSGVSGGHSPPPPPGWPGSGNRGVRGICCFGLFLGIVVATLLYRVSADQRIIMTRLFVVWMHLWSKEGWTGLGLYDQTGLQQADSRERLRNAKPRRRILDDFLTQCGILPDLGVGIGCLRLRCHPRG